MRHYDILLEPSTIVKAAMGEVDETLILENLKLTPQQRLDKMIAVQTFADELLRVAQASRGGQ